MIFTLLTPIIKFFSKDKRVYCKKCIYYNGNTSVCDNKNNISISGWYGTIIHHEKPYVLNKNNDCKNFRWI